MTALLNRLKQSNLVEYANPFLIYTDGSKQGITDRFIVTLRDALDVAILNQMVSDNALQIIENYLISDIYDRMNTFSTREINIAASYVASKIWYKAYILSI